ncbi:MAG: NAD-dependent epimerase/dehydratase family protein [Bryobacterales bacterium]
MRVVALDNLRRRGSELNLPRLRAGGVEFVHGDIREPDDLATVRPNWIIECSAEASVQAGYDQSPDYLIQSNLVGCYRCLELARRTDAGMVFLSTSRVYPVSSLNGLAWAEDATRFRLLDDQTAAGASARGVTEEFATTGARSLYGMTKLAAELMIEEYGDAFGMPYVINRCGLIAGPWQMGKSDQGVVALWMAAHCFGRGLRYIGYGGTGKQVRDVLHVDDLVELTLDQIAHPDDYAGKTFNVGGGLESSLSLLEMTTLCREISGRTIAITPEAQERKADLRVYLSDSAKVEAVRGWKPKRSAAQTLEDIHKWIQSRHAELAPVLAA